MIQEVGLRPTMRFVHLCVMLAAVTLLMSCSTSTGPSKVGASDPARFPVPGKLIVTEQELSNLPEENLVALMGHDLPWNRAAAVAVLSEKGKASAAVFTKALDSSDWRVVRSGQDGLAALLAKARKEKREDIRNEVFNAVPGLRRTLKHKHYFVRMGALDCFNAMGADAKVVIDDICPCFNDEDFLGVAPRAAAVIGAIGVENIDPKIIVPVLGKAVRSVNISIRNPAIGLIAKLDEKHQRTLIPDMQYALTHPMLDGYTRFQVQGRVADLLEALKVEGVLPMMVSILNQSGWGESHRISTFLPKIMKYGDKAVIAIPAIEKNIAWLKELKRDKPDNKNYMLLINSLKALNEVKK